MNGRVYDPYTAQFFSPDPYVQAPSEWLNYNRYSYAMGNPFKFTDPTGEQAALNNDGTYDYWGMGGDSGWNMYPGGYNQYSSYNNSGGYSGGYSSYVYSGANPGNYAFAAFTNNPVATTYTANGNGGTAGSWTFTPAYEYRYIYDDAGNIIAIVQRMVTGITAIREKEPEMNSTARHRNVTGGSSNGGFGWSDGVGIAWTGASTYANNFMQMAAETSFRS
jgi:hypothetical protein